MHPSKDCHVQSIPWSSSYSSNPSFHSFSNTPAFSHFWNQRWAEELVQMPVASRAFHWHPVRSTIKMAVMAWRGSTGGLWHPKGCGAGGGSNGFMRSHNASEIA